MISSAMSTQFDSDSLGITRKRASIANTTVRASNVSLAAMPCASGLDKLNQKATCEQVLIPALQTA